MALKQELRQRLRKVLGDLPADDINAKSLRVCHKLLEQPEYAKAEVVMIFLSMPTEVDTGSVVLRCWQERKRVLAPKVSWNQRRLMPVEIRSLTDDLTVSDMGIREPVAGIPFPIGLIDLVLVPGLGFDEFGNRLGRGRGFYDRFLSHADFRGTACAIAFEEQVTTNVPVGPLDRPMDMLVTDAKVRRFKRT